MTVNEDEFRGDETEFGVKRDAWLDWQMLQATTEFPDASAEQAVLDAMLQGIMEFPEASASQAVLDALRELQNQQGVCKSAISSAALVRATGRNCNSVYAALHRLEWTGDIVWLGNDGQYGTYRTKESETK